MLERGSNNRVRFLRPQSGRCYRSGGMRLTVAALLTAKRPGGGRCAASSPAEQQRDATEEDVHAASARALHLHGLRASGFFSFGSIRRRS
jgi:hypothetical protein